MPSVCPQCKGTQLKLQGFGTQRVEQDLAALFPEAKVLRMDLDTTTRRGSHDKLLQQFGRGDADILLGTQMVAKGLDFPRVSLVGVISADTQMLLPDFRSAERTFQLLTQVAGRAGRSSLKGEVVIQSFQTDHYTLNYVIDHNYRGFYEEEFRYRQSALYPPFARLVMIECKGTDERNVQHTAEAFSNRLKRLSPQSVVLGPAAAVISKIKNNFRWQIIVKAVKTNDPNSASVRNAIHPGRSGNFFILRCSTRRTTHGRRRSARNHVTFYPPKLTNTLTAVNNTHNVPTPATAFPVETENIFPNPIEITKRNQKVNALIELSSL